MRANQYTRNTMPLDKQPSAPPYTAAQLARVPHDGLYLHIRRALAGGARAISVTGPVECGKTAHICAAARDVLADGTDALVFASGPAWTDPVLGRVLLRQPFRGGVAIVAADLVDEADILRVLDAAHAPEMGLRVVFAGGRARRVLDNAAAEGRVLSIRCERHLAPGDPAPSGSGVWCQRLLA
jgi:hypothetical protein